jgi:5,10-methylenetetrahydromethanopterin reductase
MPRFGLNRFDWSSLERFVADVRECESLGFGLALHPVNPLALPDPYVWLAFAARETNRIRVGPFIDNPVLKHPALVAGSIATLDEISGGRALLGYGVGDTAVRWLGRKPARVVELEDATRTLRGLLAGEALALGAARPARLQRPRRVPVWIAAGGPQALRAAGRVADGVFLRVGRHPANLHAAAAAVRAGAHEAGRPPHEPALGLVLHWVTSAAPAAVRAISRAMAAGFYEYSPGLFEPAGLAWEGPPIAELKRAVWPDFHHAADLVRAGGLVEFLSDEAAESFSLFGSAEDVVSQLRRALSEVSGVEWVVPHPVPLPPPGSPYKRWLAEQVMSRL